MIDWTLAGTYALSILTAYALALPIAWNREKQERTAGLRTFPLVATASCAYALTGFAVLDPESQGRIMQGLITGMGFIGGGAVIKRGEGIVQGTATATSLWATGAIGLAVAAEKVEIAIIVSALTFVTLAFLKPVKESLNE